MALLKRLFLYPERQNAPHFLQNAVRSYRFCGMFYLLYRRIRERNTDDKHFVFHTDRHLPAVFFNGTANTL